MYGEKMAFFPNRRYICEDCGRDLGDTISRLRKRKTPNANIINGKVYCDKCADKHWQTVFIRR